MVGWLIYGTALNAGRKLFPEDDKGFGRWKQREIYSSKLEEKPDDRDEAAAIWATDEDKHPGSFEATRGLHPRVRTVRGLHAKWKEAQRPEPKEAPVYEEPTEAERETCGS